MFPYHPLLGLTLLILPAVRGDIDYSICNPGKNSSVPIPPPILPPSYTATIEWKSQRTNSTSIVEAYRDGINHLSSQIITSLGQTTHLVYDDQEGQYVTMNDTVGCLVQGMGSIVMFNDKFWLATPHMIYNLITDGNINYLGKTVIRGTWVDHWQTCVFLAGHTQYTNLIDIYFSSDGWGMAESSPAEPVPVRIDISGSSSTNGSTFVIYKVTGDFINFNPRPIEDFTKLQPNPGVYCSGRKSRMPIFPVPSSFSLIMERIDEDYRHITYESVWFDAENKLVRRDFKDAGGSDLDPSVEIFDLTLGIHYSMDPYMGTCNVVSNLNPGDLFITRNGTLTDKLRMKTSLEFFHMEGDNAQYVGTRRARGILCDVWSGQFLDMDAGRNETVEWYFTKQSWILAVDIILQSASLVRMDVWKGGSKHAIVYNVLRLDGSAPRLSVFNVAPCFDKKTRIIAHFTAPPSARVDQISKRFLKNKLHNELVNRAMIPPLRVSESLLSFSKTNDIYFAATLVDQAPTVNPNIWPPPTKQHSLDLAYEFLVGTMARQFNITLKNTIKQTIILTSQGLRRIDYGAEFITTSTIAPKTTPEKTPSPPTIAPNPIPSQVPTLGSTTILYPPTKPAINIPSPKPLTDASPATKPQPTATVTKTTASPTTKVTKTTASPTTKVTKTTASPRPLTHSVVSPTTSKTCTCPTVTCPTPTADSSNTQKPVTCPTIPSTTVSPPPTKTTTKATPSPSTKAARITPGIAAHQPQTSRHTGYTSGTMGGLAVGMLLVGALIGGVLTLFFYKRYYSFEDAKHLVSNYTDDDNHY